MKQRVTERKDIPDKVYFRIGEVSELVGVDPHVLRYWESEFRTIRPRRAKSNQRLYRRQDVENLLLIRELLHGRGYTIAGARKLLLRPEGERKAILDSGDKESGGNTKDKLQLIKKELVKIQQILALKSLRY
ncbi:MAG: MerR family transcriptional regulator [Desulfobulbaceae bacterium]